MEGEISSDKKNLGVDPFNSAYDLIFEMAEAEYVESGAVRPQLIGITFKGGCIGQCAIVLVDVPQNIANIRNAMINRFPMVAHVFEDWGSPDASMPLSKHSDKYEMIGIMLHTREFLAAANCKIDPMSRKVEKTKLIMPSTAEGRMSFGLNLNSHKNNLSS